jgi:hypothetical protein
LIFGSTVILIVPPKYRSRKTGIQDRTTYVLVSLWIPYGIPKRTIPPPSGGRDKLRFACFQLVSVQIIIAGKGFIALPGNDEISIIF